MARKILLADDSVTAQNMGRKILADAGYDVVTVNNGSAALKRVHEVKPDLIVLDVYMPGYSGLEVCQRLKDAGDTSHIPVLLTVGKLEPFKVEEGKRVRADSHIIKPFEASELLSAITRLEERMPAEQSASAGRFGATAKPGRADSESDWKSRLNLSSKTKKEEPEAEPADVTAAATFRDFRAAKANTKAAAAGAREAKPLPPPVSDVVPHIVPGIVPDVPRDITPEEMDALSALASKLNVDIPDSKLNVETPEAFAAAKTRLDLDPVSPEAAVQSAPQAAELQCFAIEGKSDVEIPAESGQEAEKPAEVAEPAAIAAFQPGFQNSELQREVQHPDVANPPAPPAEPPIAAAVDTTLLAQEPAPVDRADEPTFAAAVSSAEPAGDEKTHGASSEAAVVSASANAEADASRIEEPPANALEASFAASGFEQPASSLAHTAIPLEAAEAAPSEAELVEALRLLTPSLSGADASSLSSSLSSSMPPNEVLAAAGQLLAEAAVRDAADAPRWVAEPITLSPEEAASSLEAEMISTLAAVPTVDVSGVEAAGITGVSAIAAAVESRLAEVESVVSAKSPEQAVEASVVATSSISSYAPQSDRHSSEMIPAETAGQAAVEAMPAANAPSMEASPEAINGAAAPEESRASGAPAEMPAVEVAAKAMAAAAAETASASATDPSTIASIVESVMADLRPKIVEEIAKKLSGK